MSYDEVQYWNNRVLPNREMFAPTSWIFFIVGQLQGCENVLEFGPGVGRLFPAYKKLGHVSCFDITARHKYDLQKAALKHNVSVCFEFLPIVGITPYTDKEFDAVVCVQVLLHQRPENITRVMSELVRIAKKVIVISYHSPRPVDLSPHVFNHDYLTICQDNNWEMPYLEFKPEHILFTYGDKK